LFSFLFFYLCEPYYSYDQKLTFSDNLKITYKHTELGSYRLQAAGSPPSSRFYFVSPAYSQLTARLQTTYCPHTATLPPKAQVNLQPVAALPPTITGLTPVYRTLTATAYNYKPQQA